MLEHHTWPTHCQPIPCQLVMRESPLLRKGRYLLCFVWLCYKNNDVTYVTFTSSGTEDGDEKDSHGHDLHSFHTERYSMLHIQSNKKKNTYILAIRSNQTQEIPSGRNIMSQVTCASTPVTCT